MNCCMKTADCHLGRGGGGLYLQCINHRLQSDSWLELNLSGPPGAGWWTWQAAKWVAVYNPACSIQIRPPTWRHRSLLLVLRYFSFHYYYWLSALNTRMRPSGHSLVNSQLFFYLQTPRQASIQQACISSRLLCSFVVPSGSVTWSQSASSCMFNIRDWPSCTLRPSLSPWVYDWDELFSCRFTAARMFRVKTVMQSVLNNIIQRTLLLDTKKGGIEASDQKADLITSAPFNQRLKSPSSTANRKRRLCIALFVLHCICIILSIQ